MVRGLYTGASGMLAEWERMNVVSNNLANINTTGYKRDEAITKSFPEMLLRRLDDNGVVKVPSGSYDIAPYVGKVGTGVEVSNIHTRREQGSFKSTGNDFDLALGGRGFFVVKTDRGLMYSRDGSFTIDKKAYLVTKEGYRVQGEGGDIRVKVNNLKIDEEGQIFINEEYASEDLGSFADKSTNSWERTYKLDRLRIVNFYNINGLEKVGHNFYEETKVSGEAREMPKGEGRAKVFQGYLEMSNVNPVEEMVRMIEVQRSYEANQRTIMAHDGLLDKAVNEIGRV